MGKTFRVQEFYTIKQVADRHHRSERSIQRLIETKALKAHRFGKSVRISQEDLAAYEAASREDELE